MIRSFGVIALVGLLAGNAVVARGAIHPGSSGAWKKVTKCPAWPGGSGLLDDGDFHLAPEPMPSERYSKGQIFANGWKVAKRTVDFVGTYWPGPSGVCSVDLDGDNVGAVTHAGFRVTPSAAYTVTFQFSGAGQCPPTVKTMMISAAGQSQQFSWDTSNNNDAEHGVFQQMTWGFTAPASTLRADLKFSSLDPPGSGCGPVIAAISVTQNQ